MLLEVEHLVKSFPGRQGEVRALDDVSFSMEMGRCIGVIGESGSGKSTLAKVAAGVVAADAGTVTLAGRTLDPRSRQSRRAHQQSLQLVFQDSRTAFDPRMSIGESLREPLRYKRGMGRKEQDELVAECLEKVGLPTSFAERRMHSVSVGQAQRVGIARALLARPSLIVCDEITSALDVTVQASILRLLQDLRREENLSLLFITHDIAVVAEVASYLLVMESGQVVERGDVDDVVGDPQHPFTQALIEVA